MASTLPRLFRSSLPRIYTSPLRPLPSLHLQQRRYAASGGAGDYQFGPANNIQPAPTTQQVGFVAFTKKAIADAEGGDGGESGGDGKGGGGGDGEKKKKDQGPKEGADWKKVLEAAATTGVSLGVLGLAGYAYHRYYKYIVLDKIDHAFNCGDPALNLATATYGKDQRPTWITLPEQAQIDRIISGTEVGHYYLLVGEKGTGKTSMLLSGMKEVNGEACSMMEAHADPEIFRLRLGKALDFEFHEDYIGSLFSIRGPRDTTALLDIERALNKLEKVALRRHRRTGKPLIMIINSMHLLRNNDNGKDLLELLQQKAESWAASGLVTMIFNSDDYWVYERLKQYASRMQLISVKDLPKAKAIAALRKARARFHRHEKLKQETVEQVYALVGGRLSFLNRVAREPDMVEACKQICQDEKTWLMNKCGLLGMDMDDDVMDQQKVASSAMVLVRELVRLWEIEMKDHDEEEHGYKLPELPLYRARQIMTRADFIEDFDHDNIFTIDCRSMVRADSVPMMNAFKEVVAEEGFNEYLEETLTRINDIESLGRTRELTIKDLWHGGKYNMTVKDRKGNVEKAIEWTATPGDRDAEKEEEEEKGGKK